MYMCVCIYSFIAGHHGSCEAGSATQAASPAVAPGRPWVQLVPMCSDLAIDRQPRSGQDAHRWLLGRFTLPK